MATSYIPPKDTDLGDWADNFSALITALPATYGLLAGDATAIAAVVDPFLAALAVATTPSTRTKVTVAAKDDAKFAMLSVVRTYAQRVVTNPGVDPADKVALGLNLHGTPPTPIPPPVTIPLISLLGATPLNFTLRYADEMTPDKRAKPQGVTRLDLFLTVDTTPKTDPTKALYYSGFTKQPAFVEFAPLDAGKVATLWGRWATRKGDVGPWSAPVSQIIPSA